MRKIAKDCIVNATEKGIDIQAQRVIIAMQIAIVVSLYIAFDCPDISSPAKVNSLNISIALYRYLFNINLLIFENNFALVLDFYYSIVYNNYWNKIKGD